MGIVTTIVEALTEFVTASAGAISDGIGGLLFTTGTGGETEISTAGTVILVMLAIGFGVGLMKVIFNLIRA